MAYYFLALVATLLFQLSCPQLMQAATDTNSTANVPREIEPTTHALLPGIVGRGIADANWPRTQHDALATGFSPLVCGMSKAPSVWGEISLGGTLTSLDKVVGPKGTECLLINDGRLRFVSSSGDVLWSRHPVGNLIGAGDMRSDGGNYALFSAGPRLTLLDLNGGAELWQHEFQPNYVGVQAEIADILVDRPGLEAAFFLMHGEQGGLINFPPHGTPEIVWQHKVVDGDFNERYDHNNAALQLDLSQPEKPVIWNLRRHRCRGIDAKTGERLSTITYDIGGAHKRNYGPMYLGHGLDGQLLACVFGESVQVHSHAIRLYRDRDNELAWQHYYGEVYKEAPGVAMESHGLLDIDGDGADEMIYSVRDPEKKFRSFVRARSADTGEIKFELPDHWGIGIFSDMGPNKSAGILALTAPDGQMPTRGELEVHCINASGKLELVGKLHSASSWGPLNVSPNQQNEILLRELDTGGNELLSRFIISDGELQRVFSTTATNLLTNPIRAVLAGDDPNETIYVTDRAGELRAIAWDGSEHWSQSLQSNTNSAVSAADLDGDGRAELMAATQDGRLRVFSCEADGTLKEQHDFQHIIGSYNHHPVIYDLLGDGKLCIMTASSDKDDHLVIRAHLPDGSILWESPLPVSAQGLQGVVLDPGQFLAKDRSGIAVSLTDSRRVHEGTYMLEGRTGDVIWFKGMYPDGDIMMPYRPNGIPTAYDFDQDGVEEVGMDMLSYMAFLRGSDGEFVFLKGTHNIHPEDAVYAGHLYNTYCPLLKTPNDKKPFWFVTAGFGPFGLINPDIISGVWKEDLDYDVPLNVALVDVDGDGKLEAGYVALNDTKFICRDVWTGEIEWSVELPSAPSAATITADFDGDGRGEFFCGQYCIGVNDEGEGEIRWHSPVYFIWPIIADFDGDGDGELAGGHAGKIVILNNDE